MKTIVVGTDGTPGSGAAVAMAADLAERVGATLHLVSATSSTETVASLGGVAVPTRAPAHEPMTAVLEQQATVARRRGIDVEVHVCPGSAADVLCDVAETLEADMIVVGNRRTKGAGRLLGSVANRVVHHAPCSVLVARTTG